MIYNLNYQAKTRLVFDEKQYYFNVQLLENKKSRINILNYICMILLIGCTLWFKDDGTVILINLILSLFLIIYLWSLNEINHQITDTDLLKILLLINENEILCDEIEYRELFQHSIKDFTMKFVKTLNKTDNSIAIYTMIRLLLLVILIFMMLDKYLILIPIKKNGIISYLTQKDIQFMILLCLLLILFGVIEFIFFPINLHRLFQYIIRKLTDQSDKKSLEIMVNLLLKADENARLIYQRTDGRINMLGFYKTLTTEELRAKIYSEYLRDTFVHEKK